MLHVFYVHGHNHYHRNQKVSLLNLMATANGAGIISNEQNQQKQIYQVTDPESNVEKRTMRNVLYFLIWQSTSRNVVENCIVFLWV